MMTIERRLNRPKYDCILVACMLLTTTLLTSCALLFPHDPTTHENLIELKTEAVLLVETFDTKPFDRNEAALADLTLKFQKAYVYEKGKGKRNSDTMRQLDAVWNLLSEDIAVYREKGNAPRDSKYFHAAAVILGQAFDSALAAEKAK